MQPRHRLFADRANRDAAWTAEGRQGRRSSIRNQQLHPMYVEDRPSGDTGFGNTDYQTFWSVLYALDYDA